MLRVWFLSLVANVGSLALKLAYKVGALPLI